MRVLLLSVVGGWRTDRFQLGCSMQACDSFWVHESLYLPPTHTPPTAMKREAIAKQDQEKIKRIPVKEWSPTVQFRTGET